MFLYLFFHLNLNFSSIKNNEYNKVINKCYKPLFDIIEKKKYKIGIEASIYTLDLIKELDQDFFFRMNDLLHQNDDNQDLNWVHNYPDI